MSPAPPCTPNTSPSRRSRALASQLILDNLVLSPHCSLKLAVFMHTIIQLAIINFKIFQVLNLGAMIYILNMQEQKKIKSFPLAQEQQWLEELHKNGCVVLADVLSHQEVSKAKGMFWTWLESLGSGVKRDSPATWGDSNWPGSPGIGFFTAYGGCHTQASWYLRTHPRVKSAFASIWKTQSLIVSFDTMICWRPWWNKLASKSWQPFVENLHVDQNPHFKKGLHCVQGMVVLVDVEKSGAGGLQVVPGVNNDSTQNQLVDRYKFVKFNDGDWLQLRRDDHFVGKGKLVECRAGSLILWDSRTIHGGLICEPTEQFKKDNENELVRLAMTVTMVPKSLCSELNRQNRMRAFNERIGLTHWPQQFNVSGFGAFAQNIDRKSIKYDWPMLTPQVEDLI